MTNSYKNYSKNGILNFISFYNVSTNKIYSNLQFIHKKIKLLICVLLFLVTIDFLQVCKATVNFISIVLGYKFLLQ